MLDLEAREQRHFVLVAFDARHCIGHHHRHEADGLVVNVVGVDQDFADVGREIIADRADHQARFEINQLGTLDAVGGGLDRVPQFEQVVQVPLQLGGVAANPGGARDQAHAIGVLQRVHHFFEFGAVVALDAARNTAAARVVRHQHQVAAGQRDKRGERRALVAALVFFDLDQKFLAFAHRLLDGGVAHRHAFAEVRAGNFLERQKAVTVATVIYEAGFERGLDPGDDTLVDIAFTLFLASGFDVQIHQLLAIDDRNPQFLCVGCVE